MAEPRQRLCSFSPGGIGLVGFHRAFSPRPRPKAAITPARPAESITLPNAVRTYRGRLRIPPQVHAEVMAMQFWDAYYLAKIQEMKARRKAELEEAGKL